MSSCQIKKEYMQELRFKLDAGSWVCKFMIINEILGVCLTWLDFKYCKTSKLQYKVTWSSIEKET